MKTIHTSALLILLSLFTNSLCAQTGNWGGDVFEQNKAAHLCITPQEYALLEKQCAESRRLLGLHAGMQRDALLNSLAFPLRAAAGLEDCRYYYVSAGVDHNPVSGAFTDYNCGTVTYDGHGGTDFSIWPLNFYKMDNDLVEVIAAASGTILYKSEGHFDKNCAATTDTANYIVIQHADGSQANYWHMKKNSVTAKSVGQTVVAGEYLGVVGSSGNSSGPHLHFEVWSGSTNATRVDPFAGSCNTLNANSWWTAQPPYPETALSKVSVNTTDIVIPGCPATETPNESIVFEIPFQGVGLPAGYAKFYVFITHDFSGMNVNLSILNPDASTFNSWTYTGTANSKTNLRGWSKLLPTTPGIYTFKAEYNGTTCLQSFQIVEPASVGAIESLSSVKVYPNPSTGKFTIEFENGKPQIKKGVIEIYNLLGAQVFHVEVSAMQSEINLYVQSGVYYYHLKDNGKFITSGKLLVQ